MKVTLLPLCVFATICLTGCNTAATNQPKAAPSEEERVIIIPPVKDPTSVHNHLHAAAFPFRYDLGSGLTASFPDSISTMLTGEHILEVTGDTTKLHIKGDSCWIEYVSVGRVRSKKKDGSYLDAPTAVAEITDTVKIR